MIVARGSDLQPLQEMKTIRKLKNKISFVKKYKITKIREIARSQESKLQRMDYAISMYGNHTIPEKKRLMKPSHTWCLYYKMNTIYAVEIFFNINDDIRSALQDDIDFSADRMVNIFIYICITWFAICFFITLITYLFSYNDEEFIKNIITGLPEIASLVFILLLLSAEYQFKYVTKIKNFYIV